MTDDHQPRLLGGVFALDSRGTFSKPYPPTGVAPELLQVRELFWTTSAKGVVRGMHFQREPDAVAKLVWVSRGAIFDVLVDLREGDGFGTVTTWELDEGVGAALYVPAGFAHGFQSLADDTIVNYAQDGGFSPSNDAGVRWDSIGIDWPLPPGAISDRDLAHPALADFTYRFRPAAS